MRAGRSLRGAIVARRSLRIALSLGFTPGFARSCWPDIALVLALGDWPGSPDDFWPDFWLDRNSVLSALNLPSRQWHLVLWPRL
jgi:hypothetical protein